MASVDTPLGGLGGIRLQAIPRRMAPLAVAALVGMAAVWVVQARPFQALSAGESLDGQPLYAANCATCHGDKGDRVPVAPLYSREFLDSRGDATLLAAITDGKGVMPAFSKARSGPFSDEQTRAVLSYLNASAGRTSPSVLAGAGQGVFADQCARCHGQSGDRIPVAPLTAKGFLDAQTDSQLIAAISAGQGLMPAFQSASAGTKLSDEQVRSVVSYLRFNADVNVADQAHRGRDLYVSTCLTCHGERGDRVSGVTLASADYLRRLGDGSLTRAISDGKGSMPGLSVSGASRIQEVTSLLVYLKSWAGLPAGSALASPEASSQGSALFAANCTGCHGENGDKVPNVQLRATDFLSGRSDDILLREIGQGNTKGMPAFGKADGGPLSDDDIRNVISFLRTAPAASSSGPGVAAPPAAQSAPSGTSAVAAPAMQAQAAAISAPVNDALVPRGKTVFATNCTACHGDTRDKVPQARLFDASWLQQRGDSALTQSITRGKGAMPAWGQERGGPLAPDDVTAVLSYLKSIAVPAPPIAATPAAAPAPAPAPAAGAAQPAAASAPVGGLDPAQVARGKELFTSANCVMCHGDTRDKVPQAKLADAAWLQQQGDAALLDRITNGKAPMPAFAKEKGGSLTADDMAAIVAYLKSAAKGP